MDSKYYKRISLVLSEDLRKELKELAHKWDTSLSSCVRKIIRDRCKKEGIASKEEDK